MIVYLISNRIATVQKSGLLLDFLGVGGEVLFGSLEFLHLNLPLHHFLLGHLGLLAYLLAHSALVLVAFFGMVFPDEFKDGFGVVGGDGGLDPLAFDDDLDEEFLVFAVVVEGEPVVEVLAGDSPAVGDSFRVDEGNCLHLFKEDGFGGGEGEVVLANDDGLPVHLYLLVLVYRLTAHFKQL